MSKHEKFLTDADLKIGAHYTFTTNYETEETISGSLTRVFVEIIGYQLKFASDAAVLFLEPFGIHVTLNDKGTLRKDMLGFPAKLGLNSDGSPPNRAFPIYNFVASWLQDVLKNGTAGTVLNPDSKFVPKWPLAFNKVALPTALLVPHVDAEHQIDVAKSYKKLGITTIFDPDKDPLPKIWEKAHLAQVNQKSTLAFRQCGIMATGKEVMSIGARGGGRETPEGADPRTIDAPFFALFTKTVENQTFPLFAAFIRHPLVPKKKEETEPSPFEPDAPFETGDTIELEPDDSGFSVSESLSEQIPYAMQTGDQDTETDLEETRKEVDDDGSFQLQPALPFDEALNSGRPLGGREAAGVNAPLPVTNSPTPL